MIIRKAEMGLGVKLQNKRTGDVHLITGVLESGVELDYDPNVFVPWREIPTKYRRVAYRDRIMHAIECADIGAIDMRSRLTVWRLTENVTAHALPAQERRAAE